MKYLCGKPSTNEINLPNKTVSKSMVKIKHNRLRHYTCTPVVEKQIIFINHHFRTFITRCKTFPVSRYSVLFSRISIQRSGFFFFFFFFWFIFFFFFFFFVCLFVVVVFFSAEYSVLFSRIRIQRTVFWHHDIAYCFS